MDEAVESTLKEYDDDEDELDMQDMIDKDEFEDMLKEFIDENHEHYKDLLTKFSKPKTDEQDRI